MLARNEEAIGQLYRAYANKYPQYKDFWFNLATEEIEHANWIRQLNTKISEGSLRYGRQIQLCRNTNISKLIKS